jgi:hypothetical protein
MHVLVIRGPGRQETAFPLRTERAVIGRAEDADLVLPSVTVSRRHARVERRSEVWEVVDLGSKNGVKVGGARVERAGLAHGAVIEIGRYRVVFVDTERLEPRDRRRLEGSVPPGDRSPDAALDTLVVSGHSALETDPGVEQPVLVREDGQGGRWPLGTGRLTIGPSGHVPLGTEAEIGLLAEILWDGRVYRLNKLSLMARVELNGARVTSAILAPGDRMDIGEGTFRFLVDDGLDG